jgi:Virulence activator alpha C-term
MLSSEWGAMPVVVPLPLPGLVVHAERLAVYRDIQERDFPDPQHLSYEQRFLYLPLLRGLMFETENVTWCDAAIDLLQEGMETLY